MTTPTTFHNISIDHIPILWCSAGEAAGRDLVIWLPGLGGAKEGLESHLKELAEAGFVAVSFDPWQHGARKVAPPEKQGWGGADRSFRHFFWPMIAHTAEETSRVIDWAIGSLGVTEAVRMGGISMGGDISVAAAGLDHRIGVVAAGVATPDWLRTGTDHVHGEADLYAQRWYDRLNPLTNLASYAHCPAITFQNGAEDTLVPPDGAERFAAALRETYRECPERLDVSTYPGVGHEFTPVMWAKCVEWFRRW